MMCRQCEYDGVLCVQCGYDEKCGVDSVGMMIIIWCRKCWYDGNYVVMMVWV